MPDEDDDILAQLGVDLEALKRGPTAAKPAATRHTEWSNETAFKFEGYIARVAQVTCEHCGSLRETFEGVYSVESHSRSHSRRLQALGRGQQWPAPGPHKCEVRQEFTRFCPDCIRGLGFSVEVEAEDKPRQLVVKEEQS